MKPTTTTTLPEDHSITHHLDEQTTFTVSSVNAVSSAPKQITVPGCEGNEMRNAKATITNQPTDRSVCLVVCTCVCVFTGK